MYNYYLSLLKDDEDVSFLNKYLDLKSFKRIRKIGYFCGMDYASKDIYNFNEKITRADHSLSTALLVWKLTKDKNATLAGLFHDIGTPCFSHVIDYMNKDYANQESTEEFTEDILLRDDYFKRYCDLDKINYDDIINFKQYSIVDLDRPKLCADRLDGIILTGSFWTNSLTIEDIKFIIDNLTIFINEFGEKEIGFKSLKTAFLVKRVSEEIDAYCHSNEDNYMMELLAYITRLMILKKCLNYEDLYILTEEELFKILENVNDRDIKLLLNNFKNVKKKDIPKTEMPFIKKRVINPLVNGKRMGDL